MMSKLLIYRFTINRHNAIINTFSSFQNYLFVTEQVQGHLRVYDKKSGNNEINYQLGYVPDGIVMYDESVQPGNSCKKYFPVHSVYGNKYRLFNVLCWLWNIYEGAELLCVYFITNTKHCITYLVLTQLFSKYMLFTILTPNHSSLPW